MKIKSKAESLLYAINRIFYLAVRGSLQLWFGTEMAREWIQRHKEWHWLNFPFNLKGIVCWSPMIKGWFEILDEDGIGIMTKNPDFPLSWFEVSEGDIFMDVGAHAGYYSILASRLVGDRGRVIAVEPCFENIGVLRKNLLHNGISNVTLVCAAAWKVEDVLPLNIHPHFSTMHSVSSSNDESRFWVGAITIDSISRKLGLEKIDWIKIDVEGAEIEVLEGGKKTLEEISPNLIIEVHGKKAKLAVMLEDLKYNVTEFRAESGNDERYWVMARRINR